MNERDHGSRTSDRVCSLRQRPLSTAFVLMMLGFIHYLVYSVATPVLVARLHRLAYLLAPFLGPDHQVRAHPLSITDPNASL